MLARTLFDRKILFNETINVGKYHFYCIREVKINFDSCSRDQDKIQCELWLKIMFTWMFSLRYCRIAFFSGYKWINYTGRCTTVTEKIHQATHQRMDLHIIAGFVPHLCNPRKCCHYCGYIVGVYVQKASRCAHEVRHGEGRRQEE